MTRSVAKLRLRQIGSTKWVKFEVVSNLSVTACQIYDQAKRLAVNLNRINFARPPNAQPVSLPIWLAVLSIFRIAQKLHLHLVVAHAHIDIVFVRVFKALLLLPNFIFELLFYVVSDLR